MYRCHQREILCELTYRQFVCQWRYLTWNPIRAIRVRFDVIESLPSESEFVMRNHNRIWYQFLTEIWFSWLSYYAFKNKGVFNKMIEEALFWCHQTPTNKHAMTTVVPFWRGWQWRSPENTFTLASVGLHHDCHSFEGRLLI